jgi:hypothetical protein
MVDAAEVALIGWSELALVHKSSHHTHKVRNIKQQSLRKPLLRAQRLSNAIARKSNPCAHAACTPREMHHLRQTNCNWSGTDPDFSLPMHFASTWLTSIARFLLMK